ncbi:MAG TPA: hypothetical protein VNA15_04950 [Candidatus Angelobacter sp.]|nr:hypothetical protein [Candidatus Angelobacter sp.]
MNSKIVVVVVIAIAAVGIAYSSMLNSQPAQPTTSTNNCRTEDVAGNFTSSPQMSDASNGPYNVTLYVWNLASQSATITQYTDNNGLTQPVNWIVPASTTKSFQTTIYKPENSLVLETSCSTLFTTNYYHSNTSSPQTKHYKVNLFVSLGGTAS